MPTLSRLACLLAFLTSAQLTAQAPEQGQSLARRHTLMPVPSSIAWAAGELRVDGTSRFALTRFADERLRGAVLRTIARLEALIGQPISRSTERVDGAPSVSIAVERAGEAIQSPAERESYVLDVTPRGAVLSAETVVGAMRGLETLLQLVESDSSGFSIPAVRIADMPRFRWRGLLLDVARHFMPAETVKRTLDGMAAVKLNVFHWHLSDDQGFRVESKRYPRLHSSGSDGLYYTQQEIREIVAYARDRGIRVIPEFDMPGHSTAWFAGHPELASLPGSYEIWRSFGVGQAAFDPTKEEAYKFIGHFVAEMAALFPDRYWHVGGDEVDPRHWDRNPRIRAFRRANGFRTNAELQAHFNRRLTTILGGHGKRLIGWDEILHPALPRNSIVQAWRGPEYLGHSTALGFTSILSAPYYLDHIRTAEEHYIADPIPPWTDLTPEQQLLVLGAEACMWSEHVDAETLDSRLWPRLAAVAERFWSPREVIQVNDMYRRLEVQSRRLAALGMRHLDHTDRMLRRIAADDTTRHLLRTMLEAVAPPTFGQRVRGQATTQLTPLVRMIDAAVPDPPGRWEVSMLVDRLLTDPSLVTPRLDSSITVEYARSRLRDRFQQWAGVDTRIRAQGSNSPLVAEAVPAATALAITAGIGLEALRFMQDSTAVPEPGWADGRLQLLKRFEEPQALLRVMIVQPVRRLVVAISEEGTARPSRD